MKFSERSPKRVPLSVSGNHFPSGFPLGQRQGVPQRLEKKRRELVPKASKAVRKSMTGAIAMSTLVCPFHLTSHRFQTFVRTWDTHEEHLFKMADFVICYVHTWKERTAAADYEEYSSAVLPRLDVSLQICLGNCQLFKNSVGETSWGGVWSLATCRVGKTEPKKQFWDLM